MYPTAIVDEAELGQLATLIARLTPEQQRLVAALATAPRRLAQAIPVGARLAGQ